MTHESRAEMEDLKQHFKATMAHYPSGVVIITTRDAEGVAHGFTATSFSSLSMDPPSILVCLASSAFCYDAFIRARHFVVNFVDARHDELALQFSRRGADKFGGVATRMTGNDVPVLDDAVAFIECEAADHLVSGDHTILVGNVLAAQAAADRDVLVHYRRQFGRVSLAAAPIHAG